MAWIRTVGESEATGRLKTQYDAALARTGKVWNIVKLHSLNPDHLAASMHLYRAVMFGDSPLSRAQREMIAVVVSRANRCEY